MAEDNTPDQSLLRTDPQLPPVGTREKPSWTLPKVILWVAIAERGPAAKFLAGLRGLGVVRRGHPQ